MIILISGFFSSLQVCVSGLSSFVQRYQRYVLIIMIIVYETLPNYVINCYTEMVTVKSRTRRGDSRYILPCNWRARQVGSKAGTLDKISLVFLHRVQTSQIVLMKNCYVSSRLQVLSYEAQGWWVGHIF